MGNDCCSKAFQTIIDPQSTFVKTDLSNLKTLNQFIHQAILKLHIKTSSQKISINLKDSNDRLIPLKNQTDYKIMLADIETNKIVMQYDQKNSSVIIIREQYKQFYEKNSGKIKVCQRKERLNNFKKEDLQSKQIQYLQVKIINQKNQQLRINLHNFKSLKQLKQQIMLQFNYQPYLDFQITYINPYEIQYILDTQQKYLSFLQKQIHPNEQIIFLIFELNLQNFMQKMDIQTITKNNNINIELKSICKIHKKTILPKNVYVCSLCLSYYLCQQCYQKESLRHGHPFFKASIGSLELLDCNEYLSQRYDQYKKQIKMGPYYNRYKIQDKQVFLSQIQNDICFRTIQKNTNQRQLFFLYNFQSGNKYSKQLKNFKNFDSFPNYVKITNFDESKINQIRAVYKTILNAQDDFLGLIDYLSYQQKLKKNDDEQSYYVQRAMKIFQQKNIIKYYTQEQKVKPSLYKIINKTLKMALDDPFLLAYLRYPLKKLSNQIKQVYTQRMMSNNQISELYKKQFKVNRKTWIQQQEFKDLISNVGEYIQMLGFLSTSMGDKYRPLQQDNTHIQIIKKKGNKKCKCLSNGFAILKVQKLTQIQEEQEVLFNIQSIFKIIKAQQKLNQKGQTKYSITLEYVELPTFVGIDQKLKYLQLYPQQKIVLECLQNHSLQAQKIQNQGDCLKVLNLFNQADKFYFQQLRMIDLNNSDKRSLQKISKIFLSMGILQKYKNDVNNAGYFFKKSLTIQNHLKEQGKTKALVSLNISSLIRNSETQVDLNLLPYQAEKQSLKIYINQYREGIKKLIQNYTGKNIIIDHVNLGDEYIQILKLAILYFQVYQQKIDIIGKEFQISFNEYFYYNYLNKILIQNMYNQSKKITMLNLINKMFKENILKMTFHENIILTKKQHQYLEQNLKNYFDSIKYQQASLIQYQNIILSVKNLLILQNKFGNFTNNNQKSQKVIAQLKQNILENFGIDSLMYSKFMDIKIIFLIQCNQNTRAQTFCKQNILLKQIILGKQHLQVSKAYYTLSVIQYRMFNLSKCHQYVQISLRIAKKNSHLKYIKFLLTINDNLENTLRMKGNTLKQIKQKSEKFVRIQQNGNLNYLKENYIGNDREQIFTKNLQLNKFENFYNYFSKDSFKNYLSSIQNGKFNEQMGTKIVKSYFPSLNNKLICGNDDCQISTNQLYICTFCNYLTCLSCFLTKKQFHKHSLLRIQISNCLFIRQCKFFYQIPVFMRLYHFSCSQIKLKDEIYQFRGNNQLCNLRRKQKNQFSKILIDDHTYYSNYIIEKNLQINQLNKNQFPQFLNLAVQHQSQEQMTFQFIYSYLKAKDQNLSIMDYIVYEAQSNNINLKDNPTDQSIQKKFNYYQSLKNKSPKQLFRQNEQLFLLIKTILNQKKNKLYSYARFPLQIFYNSIKDQYQKNQSLYKGSFQISSDFSISQTMIQSIKKSNGQYIRIISFLQVNSKQLISQKSISDVVNLKIYKKQSKKQIYSSTSGFIILQQRQIQAIKKPSRVLFNPGNIFKVKFLTNQLINSSKQKQIFIELQYFQFPVDKAYNIKLSQSNFEPDQQKILEIYQYKSLYYQNQPNYFHALSKQNDKIIPFKEYMQICNVMTNYDFMEASVLFQIGKAIAQNSYNYQQNTQKLNLLKALEICKSEPKKYQSLKRKILVFLGSLFLQNKQLPIIQVDPTHINIKANIKDLIQYLQQNKVLKFYYDKSKQQISNILKDTFLVILNKIQNEIDNISQIQTSFDEYFILSQVKKVSSISQDYQAYTYLTELVHEHLYCMNFDQINFYTKKQLTQMLKYLQEYKNQSTIIDTIQAAQCSWLCYRALNYIYLKLNQFQKAFSVCKQIEQKLMKFYGQNQLIKAKIKELYIQYYLNLNNKHQQALKMWKQLQKISLQRYYEKNYLQRAKIFILKGLILMRCKKNQKAIQYINIALTALQQSDSLNKQEFFQIAYICKQVSFIDSQKVIDSSKFLIDQKLLQQFQDVMKQKFNGMSRQQKDLFNNCEFNLEYHFKNINLQNHIDKMQKKRQKHQKEKQTKKSTKIKGSIIK